MPFSTLDTQGAHMRHGIKTGIAAVLAYGFASLLDPVLGVWAVVTSVIVMQMNVAESVQMCWDRFTGTAMGAAMGILAMLLFPESPSGTVLALFCSVAFCAYMTRYNPRYRMAAITVAIVLIASMGQENRVGFGMMRVVDIAIGVLCSFAVSVWVWPVRAGLALRTRVNEQSARMADTYGALAETFLGNPVAAPVTRQTLEHLLRDADENRSLFRKMLRHEQRLYDDNASLLDRQILALEQCARHLQSILDIVLDAREGGYALIMAPEIRAVVSASRTAMLAIGQGTAPDAATLRRLMNDAEQRLEELRASGATKRFTARELAQVFSFFHCVQHLGEDLRTALAGENAD